MTSFHDSQKPLLPVTVQDQIRLWELERNRIKTQEGMLGDLYESFIILNFGYSPRPRVLVHRVRVPGRLRVRPQLRTTAGRRVVGKCCEALFLWQRRGACEHSWFYRTTYRRWIGARDRGTP